MTLVEDRVILVRGRSFEEAIRLAEKEAKKYIAETTHRNPYGQPIKQRYLGFCDAYELFVHPDAGVEVFSSTKIVSKTMSDSMIIERIIGANESQKEYRQRRNFVNIAFNKPAIGVKPKKNEQERRERMTRRAKTKTES